MSSNLKVNTILPSTGTSIGIGTAGGLITSNSPLSIAGIATITGDTGNVRLDLHSTASGTGSQIKLHNDHATTYFGQAGDTTGDLLVYNESNTNIRFFTNGNNERLRIASDGRVTIANSGSGGTADVNADNFVVKNYTSSGSCGISILNADNLNSTLYFGNASDSKHAELVWSDAANLFLMGTSNAGAAIKLRSADQSDAVIIDSSQRVGVGTMSPDTLVEIGNAIGTGTANLLKLTSYTNSQSSRPALVFWNNNPNTAQAQISAKGGASYNASKLFFSVANTSRALQDRACIDEYGTVILGGGEVRKVVKGSNQHQAVLIDGTGNNSTRVTIIRHDNSDNGPEIQLVKTRGTSLSSLNAPQGGDYLGALTFIAGDGSDLNTRGADIGVQATGPIGNDTCPADIVFSVTNVGANSPTERLRIGATGVTTTSANIDFPDGKMAIFGNSSDLQIWHDSNNSRISDRGGAGNLQIESNNAILLQTNDSTNCMAKFFPTGNYQNEFYNDNDWNHPKLRTSDHGVDLFHSGDFGLSFSDDIGEIGDVAGFQAVNKAMNANTDFGIRATSIRLATGSTERMRVQSNGRVKIGAIGTAALGALHIESSDTGTDTALFIGSNSDNRFLAVHENSGNSQFSHLELKYNDNGKRPMLQLHNPYSSGTGFGSQILFKGHGGNGQAYIETSNTTSGSAEARLDIFTINNKGISIDKDGQVMCCSDVSFASLPISSGNASMMVRGDSGAWALKLLCRHDQNDYAYLGFASMNNSENLAEIYTHRTGTSQGTMYFGVRNGSGAIERLRLSSGGEVRIADELTISRDNNNASGFTKGGKILSTPAYNEYHYTWSGQSSYTIDLTCASYFHSEFIYTQHQTNGGNEMHYYARGKWANNHVTHTGYMYEMSGDGGGLSVSFTVSDQSGNGAVDMKAGLTASGAPGATYRGLYGGGNEGSSSNANGRLRIAETYSWGSVSTRSLIVRVYYGSFSISKS